MKFAFLLRMTGIPTRAARNLREVRGTRLIAALLGVSVLGSVAIAEPEIGSRVGDRIDTKRVVQNDRDAAQIAHQLAGCLLSKRGSAAPDYLKTRNAEEADKLHAKMSGDVECLANIPANDFVQQVNVYFPTDIMRGDLAEELLKRDRRDSSALQPLPLQRIYTRDWFPFTGRNVSVDEMAACVADTNPAGVVALIDTEPFSPSEGAAFGNLIPSMGPCLRAGTKLDGRREPLRAALAEALYQRMIDPSASIPASPQQASAQQAK